MSGKPFFHPPKVFGKSKKMTEAVLWNLVHEGPVEDKSGRAAQLFRERLGKVGYDMSINTLNRIVNSLGERGGQHGDMYPYNYIERVVNGKNTKRIALIVDHTKVAFPPDPFRVFPQFHSAAPKEEPAPEPERVAPKASRVIRREEEPETFARQAQSRGTGRHTQPPDQFPAPPGTTPPDPEPEPASRHCIVEAEPEPVPVTVDEILEVARDSETVVGELDLFRTEPVVRTNGSEHVAGDEDLFTDLDELFPDFEAGGRSSAELIAAAIGMLTNAMAAQANEGGSLTADAIDDRINQRLGEYRALQDRTQLAERKLRHAVTQYRKALDLIRQHRAEIVRLRRQNEELRAKTSA